MRKIKYSFEQWCMDNDRKDLLDRWDYNLNDKNPSNLSYGSAYKAYFKCPDNPSHKSHATQICNMTRNKNVQIKCIECESLGQWCVDNNHEEWIDLWDEELNKISVFEIAVKSNKKFYFKCPRGIHESNLIIITTITRNPNRTVCDKCNSLGQYILDTYGKDGFKIYWSDMNTIDPFEISMHSGKKVWLKCSNDKTHPDYNQVVDYFTKGIGCPYCHGVKVCQTNSLACVYPEIVEIWSDKNKFSPYDVTYGSEKHAWLKCKDNIHKDFKRQISNIKEVGLNCPECVREEITKYEDLTDEKFGRLTVLFVDEESLSGNGIRWWCECSCGNQELKSILAMHLKSGKIQSCGCLWRESITGENNHSWRGGVTTGRTKERGSGKYKMWSKNVYRKDFYTCQCCGKSSKIKKNAHHIVNFSDNIEDRYNLENGITLCAECHSHIYEDSFHKIYGNNNNSPEQLEQYINYKRKKLGIDIPFDIEKYMSGNILYPDTVNIN